MYFICFFNFALKVLLVASLRIPRIAVRPIEFFKILNNSINILFKNICNRCFDNNSRDERFHLTSFTYVFQANF